MKAKYDELLERINRDSKRIDGLLEVAFKLQERVDRLEDALNASRPMSKQGIACGVWLALRLKRGGVDWRLLVREGKAFGYSEYLIRKAADRLRVRKDSGIWYLTR
jgi:hypothetical protein